MRTKWLLIALPLLILGVLLQSAFWVPTYASQAQDNPKRLSTFIRADLGDVKQLNEVVARDKWAQDISHRNLFEGLVDEDENLELMPRLAQSYETTEEGYLAVLPDRKLADGTPVSGKTLLDALQSAWKDGRLGPIAGSIVGFDLVPAEMRRASTTVLTLNAKGRSEPLDVKLTIDVPERVRIRLSKVETALFRALETVVGASYFSGYPFASRFKLEKPEHLPLVEPRFASLLAVGEHNPIITFHLRPNVRWHDGVPFTGEDVKFTYDAVMNPKNASSRTGSFEPVKSIEVVDPLTVRVTYKRLHAQGIIDWEIGLVPKHLLDDAALAREADRRKLSPDARKALSVRTTTFNQNPIGTGPFRFTRWLPDQFVQLTRNDEYWGPKALYEEAYFRAIPDYLAMELDFQAGATDTYILLPHQAERYRQDPRYRVLVNNEGAYAYIGYNARLPMFKDARVRRALGMAIDIDNVIKHVLSGEARRSTGPYYAHVPYNDPSVQPLPFDPAGAAKLLAEAGWRKNARGVLEKDGKAFAFTLITNNGNPQRKAIMQIAQEAWKKLGIECSVQTFEWTVLLEEFIHVHKFDAYVLGWGGAAINPDKFEIFHSSQTHPYEANYVGYQSEEADQLLTKIREAYDKQELVDATRRLHRLLARDQPYTFVYEPLRSFAIDRRITHHKRLPDGRVVEEELRTPPSGDLFRFLSDWHKSSGAPQATAH